MRQWTVERARHTSSPSQLQSGGGGKVGEMQKQEVGDYVSKVILAPILGR